MESANKMKWMGRRIGGSRKKLASKSVKAGLQFLVARVARFMRRGRYSQHLGTRALIYLTAILEYLAAEVLDLAGNLAVDNNKPRISPRHVELALKRQ